MIRGYKLFNIGGKQSLLHAVCVHSADMQIKLPALLQQPIRRDNVWLPGTRQACHPSFFIIAPAPPFISQYLVSIADSVEALQGQRILLYLIRVILLGESPVSLTNSIG